MNDKGVEMRVVESSSVAAIGYDGSDLFVEFVNGSTYKYKDVPIEEVEGLYAAESVGSWVNVKIKPFFTCEQMS